ncbi:TonB-dependent receptor [Mongoliitalea lutea]|uniref:TonB-dependent receptor n=1 Tax=Mongoliitalea lutea TaxID=849756 RepID=A0A8J3G4Q8_9BACT|nr:TonB-dependent receptor [Mongoliitalea lutea]GHB32625.1 TonB-dependent receptor [Mongoliitalea lutea]
MGYFRVFFFFFFTSTVLGQVTITGYIKDRSSKESLYGANVYEVISQKGVSSNFDGFFSIRLNEGDQKLQVSHVGYRLKSIPLTINKDTLLFIDLEPMMELNEVVIESDRAFDFERSTQLSTIRIPIRQIRQMPAIGGEIDVIRAIQLLPGVQSGKEGLTGFYVRGGGMDQNLILLDGVPLYNISHIGGIFSIFNADVISDVELIKGGFPARYGGRLSSVLNIKAKEGNRLRSETSGAIGLVSSRIAHEAPINRGKGSFIVAGRRSYLDLFTRPISKRASKGEFSLGYDFYDFNGKVNYDLSEKDKILFSMYSGRDKGIVRSEDRKFLSETKNSFEWGNFLASMKWTRRINDKILSNFSAGYTRYEFLVDLTHEDKVEKRDISYIFKSGIEDIHLKYDWETLIGSGHLVRAGVQYINHFFFPGVSVFSQQSASESVRTRTGSFDVRANDLSFFVEDEWEISRTLSANIGLRYNNYLVNGESYDSFQPRVNVRYMLSETSSMKASYATMQQNVHLLNNTGVGLPVDLWVPATEQTQPQFSAQWTLAYNRRLSRSLELSGEVFYKDFKHLIAYSDGINWMEGTGDWQEKIERDGVGRAYGLELFLQKKMGKASGWLGYTLSRSEMRFENINSGNFFPHRFDRTHDIGLTLVYEFSKDFNFSFNWVYGTGEAITLARSRHLGITRGLINFNNERSLPTIEFYGDRNSFRMRAYHRADVGLRFSKDKKRGVRTWNLSFYNAYNRANPFYYTWSRDNVNDWNNLSLRQVAMFPIIPAFNYEFRFY